MILVALCCCFQHIKAQNNFNLPNPSFESWSQGQGYSVSVTVFSWPVYYDYTYPTNWQFPVYPFHENLSYNGIGLNIDTEIPLIKLSESTSDVPAGNKALKMQTFMLSDILGYAILNIAYSTLDSELVHSIYPSIVATGDINLDQFFPVFGNLMNDINDISNLFQSLSSLDINNYITGGLALEGFQASQLTGSYKYTSASSGGDNGGILMLGTHYNSNTHRREVVGGGFSAAFTDVNNYTPFSIDYKPLCELIDGGTSVEADSLIILLISSCNSHRLQGSALYLDNLMLIEAPVEPDTCANIQSVEVSGVTTTEGTITWHSDPLPMSWEYRYGVSGSSLSTVIETTDSTVSLVDLQADTEYEFQVRAKCDEELYSEWTVFHFRTDTLPTTVEDSTGVGEYTSSPILLYPNPANGFCHIRNSSAQTYTAALTTPDGKTLQLLTIVPGESRLELPYSGLLLLTFSTDDIQHTYKILNLK